MATYEKINVVGKESDKLKVYRKMYNYNDKVNYFIIPSSEEGSALDNKPGTQEFPNVIRCIIAGYDLCWMDDKTEFTIEGLTELEEQTLQDVVRFIKKDYILRKKLVETTKNLKQILKETS